MTMGSVKRHTCDLLHMIFPFSWKEYRKFRIWWAPWKRTGSWIESTRIIEGGTKALLEVALIIKMTGNRVLKRRNETTLHAKSGTEKAAAKNNPASCFLSSLTLSSSLGADVPSIDPSTGCQKSGEYSPDSGRWWWPGRRIDFHYWLSIYLSWRNRVTIIDLSILRPLVDACLVAWPTWFSVFLASQQTPKNNDLILELAKTKRGKLHKSRKRQSMCLANLNVWSLSDQHSIDESKQAFLVEKQTSSTQWNCVLYSLNLSAGD